MQCLQVILPNNRGVNICTNMARQSTSQEKSEATRELRAQPCMPVMETPLQVF